MSRVKYEIRKTPEMEFVSSCKEGAFEKVVELLEGGADPNTKGHVYYKNRLMGLKFSNDWGKYIMTHQSEDRLMGSALHYCVMGGKHDVFGLLLAFGATSAARLNLPPHMPHEVTVEQLIEKQDDPICQKLTLFFKVWSVLDATNPKKSAMLGKLPPSTHVVLKPYLETLVKRHQEDETLKMLKRAVAPSDELPNPPETEALLQEISG
eukprot:TRINITY_DN383_c1_g1_i1.p1 TRINITY_DN383_c1_g1~~TRINITY_DN383_c1_g1_i1.p1  ORF type:complete len:217 (+),score=33.14 TRINITY_DN383_c1_g1_i1:29-652(+)